MINKIIKSNQPQRFFGAFFRRSGFSNKRQIIVYWLIVLLLFFCEESNIFAQNNFEKTSESPSFSKSGVLPVGKLPISATVDLKSSNDFRPTINKPLQGAWFPVSGALPDGRKDLNDNLLKENILSYRYWMVPLEKIALWPWGDQKYYPIHASRFEEWISLLEKKTKKAQFDSEKGNITDLFLQARLEGTDLVNGKGKIRVQYQTDSPEGIFVDPYHFYCANFMTKSNRRGVLALSSQGDFRLNLLPDNKQSATLPSTESATASKLTSSPSKTSSSLSPLSSSSASVTSSSTSLKQPVSSSSVKPSIQTKPSTPSKLSTPSKPSTLSKTSVLSASSILGRSSSTFSHLSFNDDSMVSQEFSFQWSRHGQNDSQGNICFDLHFFSSPSTHLQLELPQTSHLRSSSGIVREGSLTDQKTRIWDIFLRGSTPVRLTVSPIIAGKKVKNRSVYRQENFYRISLSGIELTSRIYFDRSEERSNQVSFLLETPLKFTSAVWKNHFDFNALAGLETTSKGQVLTFNIPPGESGVCELDLQTFTTFSLLRDKTEISLPQPLLITPDFFWKETSCQVLVTQPLTVASVTPVNAVETFDPLSPALDDSNILYFKYFDPRANVRIQLDERNPSIRFDSLTSINLMPVEILAQTNLLIYTDIACGEFSIPITTGWQIDSVQLEGGDPLIWHLSDADTKENISQLNITLKKPFDSKVPLRVVFSTRHSNVGHLEFDLNELLPLEVNDLLFGKHFMTLKVEAPWQFSLTDRSGFPLRSDVLDKEDQARSLFHYSLPGQILSIGNGSSFGKVKIEKISAGYSGSLNGIFRVDGDLLQEKWTVSCTPVFGSRVDRILVAFDEKEMPDVTKKELKPANQDPSSNESVNESKSNTAPEKEVNIASGSSNVTSSTDASETRAGSSSSTETGTETGISTELEASVKKTASTEDRSSGSWHWTLGSEPDQAFEVNPLSEEERVSMKLPSGPAIWEIKLNTSRSIPFTISASRTRPLENEQVLPLMYLPETDDEQTEVRISSLRSDRLKVESGGLKEIPALAAKDSDYETQEGAFRYDPNELGENMELESPLKNIFLRIRRISDFEKNSAQNSTISPKSQDSQKKKEQSKDQPSASSSLVPSAENTLINNGFGRSSAWCWFANVESFYDARGTIRSNATYYIENRGIDHCRFFLPADIELSSIIAVWLDNQRVTWFPESSNLGKDQTAIRVLLPARKRFLCISLEYSRQSNPLKQTQRLYLQIPQSDLPILSGTWRLRLPQEWCCETDSINMPRLWSPFPSFFTREDLTEAKRKANSFLERFGDENLLLEFVRGKKRQKIESGNSEIVSISSGSDNAAAASMTWGELFSDPDCLNTFFKVSVQEGVSRIYVDRHAMNKLQILPATKIMWSNNVTPRSRSVSALENAGLIFIFIEPDLVLVTDLTSPQATRYPLVSLADGLIFGLKYKKDSKDLQETLYLENDPAIISSLYWRSENIGSQSPWIPNRKACSTMTNLPGWNFSEVLLSRSGKGLVVVDRYVLLLKRWFYFALVLIIFIGRPRPKSLVPYFLLGLFGLSGALLPIVSTPYSWQLLGIAQGAFCSLLIYLIRTLLIFRRNGAETESSSKILTSPLESDSSSSIPPEKTDYNLSSVRKGSSVMQKNVLTSIKNRDKSRKNQQITLANKEVGSSQVSPTSVSVPASSSALASTVPYSTNHSETGSNEMDLRKNLSQVPQSPLLNASAGNDRHENDSDHFKDNYKDSLKERLATKDRFYKENMKSGNSDAGEIYGPYPVSEDDSSSTFISTTGSNKKTSDNETRVPAMDIDEQQADRNIQSGLNSNDVDPTGEETSSPANSDDNSTASRFTPPGRSGFSILSVLSVLLLVGLFLFSSHFLLKGKEIANMSSDATRSGIISETQINSDSSASSSSNFNISNQSAHNEFEPKVEVPLVKATDRTFPAESSDREIIGAGRSLKTDNSSSLNFKAGSREPDLSKRSKDSDQSVRPNRFSTSTDLKGDQESNRAGNSTLSDSSNILNKLNRSNNMIRTDSLNYFGGSSERDSLLVPIQEPYRVFVPTDNSGNRIPNHYYWIPEEFYQKLGSLVRSYQGAVNPWLITSAYYEGSVNYNPSSGALSFFHLRAVYKVFLKGTQATLVLPMMPILPEGGAKFDKQTVLPIFEQKPSSSSEGNSSSTGNTNSSPVISKDHLTFEISDTTPGEHLLELTLAIPQFGDGNRVEIAIPKVPDSRLELNAPSDAPEISVENAIGLVSRQGGVLSAELGPISHLTFVKKDDFGSTDEKKIDVEQFFLMTARSNQTDLQAIFKFKNSGGKIKSLLIQNDRNLIFSGQCRCDESAIELIERDSTQKDLIRIVLKDYVSDAVTLRTDYVVKQFSGVGQITAPRIYAVGGRIIRNWLAVTQIGRSEFVNLPQYDVTAASFLGLSGFEGIENTLTVYDLLKKDPAWMIPVKLKEGIVSIEEYLALVFYSRETRVDYQADLSTEYQIFRSSFTIDPDFLPEKIYVNDSTGTLVEMPDFLCKNNHLYVFYRTPLVGDYRIRLTGKLRSVLDHEVAVPKITMDNAVHKNLFLSLYRDTSVCVDIKKSKKWATITSLPKTISHWDPALENSLVLLEQFAHSEIQNSSGIESAGTVVIRFNQPKLDGHRKSILYRKTNGTWMLGIFYSLEVKEGEIDTFDFELEEICSGNVSVEPVMKSELIETGRKRVLRITPPKIIRGRFDFQFTVPLTVGSDSLRLPKVSLVGVLKDRGINSTVLHPTRLEEVAADTLHYFDFLGETEHRIFLPVRDQMDKTPLLWSITGLVKVVTPPERKDLSSMTYRQNRDNENSDNFEKKKNADSSEGDSREGNSTDFEKIALMKNAPIPASITTSSGLQNSDFNEYRIVRNYSVVLNTDQYMTRIMNGEHWFYIRTNGTLYGAGNLEVRTGRKDHCLLLLPEEYRLLDLTIDGKALPFESEGPGQWRIDLNPDRFSQLISFAFIGNNPPKQFALKEFFSLSFENNFLMVRLPFAQLKDIPCERTSWGCAFENDLQSTRSFYPCLVHQAEKASNEIWPPQKTLPSMRLDKINNQLGDWKETCSFIDALPIILRIDLEKMANLLTGLENARHSFGGNNDDFGRWYSHWLLRWWQCQNEIELSCLPGKLPRGMGKTQEKAVFFRGSNDLKKGFNLNLSEFLHENGSIILETLKEDHSSENEVKSESEGESGALVNDLLLKHQKMIDSYGIRSYYDASLPNKGTATSAFRLLHLHNPQGARFLFGVTDQEALCVDLVIPSPRKLLVLKTLQRLLIWGITVLFAILFLRSARLRNFCIVYLPWCGIFAGMVCLSLANLASPLCWLIIGISVFVKIIFFFLQRQKKKKEEPIS